LGDAAAAAYSQQQPPIPIIGFFPLSSVILQIPCRKSTGRVGAWMGGGERKRRRLKSSSQKQSEKLLKKERKGREGKGREEKRRAGRQGGNICLHGSKD
jgi:hypothetical protein